MSVDVSAGIDDLLSVVSVETVGANVTGTGSTTSFCFKSTIETLPTIGLKLAVVVSVDLGTVELSIKTAPLVVLESIDTISVTLVGATVEAFRSTLDVLA